MYTVYIHVYIYICKTHTYSNTYMCINIYMIIYTLHNVYLYSSTLIGSQEYQ